MLGARILIVDDEKLIRWSLKETFAEAGHEVATAEGGEEALRLLAEDVADVVLLDVRLPDMNGFEVLRRIKAQFPECQVAMITSYGSIESAVEAMKLGAADFIKKPFVAAEVRAIVERLLENQRLRREVDLFQERERRRVARESIVGDSREAEALRELVRKIAASDATTVLIEGESGTGKGLVAKTIHFASRRAEKPFIEINCSALPENLVESELLGHERGAFTDARQTKKGLFELAAGGTVVLDEIGDMPLMTQAKLLRIIEEKSFRRVGGVRDLRVDVRIVACTNRNLADLVRAQRFREDLYFRLNVVSLRIVPLRERRADVLALCRHFIARFNAEFRRDVKGISPQAEALLLAYGWPGNVRECRNVIERAMILESADMVLPEHLPQEIRAQGGGPAEEEPEGYLLPPGGLSMEAVERQLIKQAIEATGGNQTRAARLLNISRDALRYRMKKFGLLGSEATDRTDGEAG